MNKKIILLLLSVSISISVQAATVEDFKQAVQWEIDEIAGHKKKFGENFFHWFIPINEKLVEQVSGLLSSMEESDINQCLQYAVYHGCYIAVESILTIKKDDINLTLYDAKGRTVIQKAAREGQGRMVTMLLQHAYNQAGRSRGSGYVKLQELLDQKTKRTLVKNALEYAQACTMASGKDFFIAMLQDAQAARNAILAFEGQNLVVPEEPQKLDGKKRGREEVDFSPEERQQLLEEGLTDEELDVMPAEDLLVLKDSLQTSNFEQRAAERQKVIARTRKQWADTSARRSRRVTIVCLRCGLYASGGCEHSQTCLEGTESRLGGPYTKTEGAYP